MQCKVTPTTPLPSLAKECHGPVDVTASNYLATMHPIMEEEDQTETLSYTTTKTDQTGPDVSVAEIFALWRKAASEEEEYQASKTDYSTTIGSTTTTSAPTTLSVKILDTFKIISSNCNLANK